jgi:hypothetical protein
VVIRVGSRAAEEGSAAPNQQAIDSSDSNLENVRQNPSDQINSSDQAEQSQSQNRREETRLPNGIQPVRLKGGDLLFTSDPDLPRSRELEE